MTVRYCFLLILPFFFSPALCLTSYAAEDAVALQKELGQVETIIAELEQGKKMLTEIETAANKHLKANIAKVGMKSGIELFSNFGTPWTMFVGKVKDVIIEDFIFEGKLWGYATKRDARSAQLGIDANERYVELAEMYAVLNEVLATKDLSRFDSDQPPFKFTESWWSVPDHKEDGWLQRLTRRTYLIREFSKKINESTGLELAKMKTLKTHLEAQIKNAPAPEATPAGTVEKSYTCGENVLTVQIQNVYLIGEEDALGNEPHSRGLYMFSAAPGSKAQITLTMTTTVSPREYGRKIFVTSRREKRSNATDYEILLDHKTEGGAQIIRKTITRDLTFDEDIYGYEFDVAVTNDRDSLHVSVHVISESEKVFGYFRDSYRTAFAGKKAYAP